MDERVQRIVQSATMLAEEGGFEAVRLRDVAAHAQVALGTLYRRFPSKEAILVAALDFETARLEERLGKSQGKTPLLGGPRERVVALFGRLTAAMCRKPNLSRAILRSVVTGSPELADRATAFHRRMTDLVTAVLRAPGVATPTEEDAERTRKIALVLQQTWFAGLVGWMGGMYSQNEVLEQVNIAAELILGGAERP